MTVASARRFAIGVDYGTNSVRALVVDVDSGDEVGSHVYAYPSGDAGILLDAKDPHLARQNPADYIEGFYVSVREAIVAAGDREGFAPGGVVGIGIDTTGSTPIPVDERGVPLALHDEFAGNLAAHAWLWKDHTAWSGLPASDFLDGLDPGLALVRDRYVAEALPADRKAGELTAEVAEKVGLPPGVAVAVGAFDAHTGAVGAEGAGSPYARDLPVPCRDEAPRRDPPAVDRW